jgi:hypothetical protein
MFSAVLRASIPVFMFCAPRLIFGDSECVGSRFYVLRPRTHFWRQRGCRVPFSCYALPYSFSAVPSASAPVFMFCDPGVVFDGTEGVRSRFRVFALGHVFGGAGGVGSCFQVLRVRPRFQRYRRHRVPFSCFTLPNMFSAVRRVLIPVFIFCAPGLVFNGSEGVGSSFLILRPYTRFRWYRGRRVIFSCFALLDSFSMVPWVSAPVFMFCATGHVFGGVEAPVFIFCEAGLVFSGPVGVGSRFNVLRARTHFWRYRRRRVSFSCFALPNTFSAVQRALSPVFMFCAPGHIFGGAEGVGFRFHFLRSRTHFGRF